MTQGTPASSQIIWLEGRVKELEAQVDALGDENVRRATLTDERIEQINCNVFHLARGLSQSEYMRIFARAIEKEIRG